MVAREKDDAAAQSWERLTRRWRPALLAGAYGVLHNRPDAEDVVQDVMLEVAARDPVLEHIPYRYLQAAVHNRAVDLVRERHAQARMRERDPAASQGIAAWDPARIDERRLYADVVRFVRGMPEPERTVAKLYWWEGMTCRRIARILDIREKSAQRVVARVRRKIRDGCRSGG